jgi:hypothetical protein
MYCGTLIGGKVLLPAVALLLLLSTPEAGQGAPRIPRAALVGKMLVLVIPQERSVPGDRRPR